MVLPVARTRKQRRSARPAQPVAPHPPRAGRARERDARPIAAEPLAARRTRRLIALGVSGVAFVAYFLTAARDLFPGDTPEFVTVALSGGVAHPPGYPLISLIGVVFGRLSLGPLPFRIDLISVLCHTATIGLVFLIGERLTRNLWASAAGALVLAFGANFWAWSLVAETFPLNDLLVALVLYLLVLWHERPTSRARLIGAAAVFGLGLANHQTIALLLPAIVYLLILHRRELETDRVKLWGIFAASAVAGIVPYSYVIIAAGRHELYNWGGIQGPLDLLRQILRLDYGTGQLVSLQRYIGGTAMDRFGDFFKTINPILAVLAALGFAQAWRRVRWYFWTSLLAVFFTGPLFLAVANANPAVATARFALVRFYLLPELILATLAALGITFIVEQARRRLPAPPHWLPQAVAGAALAIAALEIVFTYHAVDISEDHVTRSFAEDILATTPQNAILLAGGDHVVLPLAYLQAVEGRRPDVTLIIFPVLSAEWYQRELRLRHPDLNLPIARYEQADALITLIGANPDRTFVLTGEQIEQSFGGRYGQYGRGLVLMVVKPDAPKLQLAELVEENERLLASYRIPSFDTIRRESFERFILSWYALVPTRLAQQFDTAKRYAEARAWYERALAIDPELPEAVQGLRADQGK
jgi:4-amino-4-deoxy-L-arabinose transferase-like glycosyltransferase